MILPLSEEVSAGFFWEIPEFSDAQQNAGPS